MKIKILVSGICILSIVFIVLPIISEKRKNYIDTSFATNIILKYHYSDKKIDVKITDENDLKILKENFNGASYADNPSCEFSIDISITLSNEENSIVFCPACDSCSKARIGNTNRYVNIKDRKEIENILGKYGALFPCV